MYTCNGKIWFGIASLDQISYSFRVVVVALAAAVVLKHSISIPRIRCLA